MKTLVKDIRIVTKKDIQSVLDQNMPIAFPTETVYGLGAKIDDIEAIKKIFMLKKRPLKNPMIVHVSNQKMISSVVLNIPKDAKKLIKKFFPGPLTLILKKKKTLSSLITANMDTVGIRMPSNKTALKLLDLIGQPIVAPSANVSGKPSSTNYKHVLDDFDGKIPLLIKGEEISLGIESTIIDMTVNPYVILRPGIITSDQIEKVLLKKLGTVSKTIAPGMIYPHYVPSKPLTVLEGDYDQIRNFLKSKEGSIFIGDSLKYKDIPNFVSMGEGKDQLIINLYKTLRSLDNYKGEEVFTHVVDHRGYMNRLMKASEGRLIKLSIEN